MTYVFKSQSSHRKLKMGGEEEGRDGIAFCEIGADIHW